MKAKRPVPEWKAIIFEPVDEGRGAIKPPFDFDFALLHLRSGTDAITDLMFIISRYVDLIQTAIRGRNPDSEKVHISRFAIEFNAEGKPAKATCPEGQPVPVQTCRCKQSFIAHFDPQRCQACTLRKKTARLNRENVLCDIISGSRRAKPALRCKSLSAWSNILSLLVNYRCEDAFT